MLEKHFPVERRSVDHRPGLTSGYKRFPLDFLTVVSCIFIFIFLDNYLFHYYDQLLYELLREADVGRECSW